MGSRCQLGGAIALQQHRMGEPADTRDIGARRRSHLLDGGAGPDLGLNFLGTQHVGDLDVEVRLLRRCWVAPQKFAQSIVGRQLELFCGVATLADDVFAVGIEPNHFEFPHGFSSQAFCRSATTRHVRTLVESTPITCADTLGGLRADGRPVTGVRRPSRRTASGR